MSKPFCIGTGVVIFYHYIGDKGIYAFPKCLKGNEIVRLGFEPTFYDVVLHVSHYVTGNPHRLNLNRKLNSKMNKQTANKITISRIKSIKF